MKIAIRADASVAIGSGHLVRCATLAGRLQECGAEVEFLCREGPGDMGGWLASAGFTVHAMAAAAGWEQDAAQARALLAGGKVEWIIVDHYGLDARWEQAVRPAARVMVIDDLANRPHACDLLLDQNLYQDQASRYDGLVPAGCELLLGPRHALVRPQFGQARQRRRARHGTVERVLVCFGGSDPGNETCKALSALQLLGRDDIAVDVVIGVGNPHRDSVREQCAALPRATLHVQAEDMAGLMLAADLCIGAGGSMSWERCCLGLPAVVVAIADNQAEAMRTLAAHGCVHYLGMAGAVTAATIAGAVAQLAGDPGQLAGMAGRALELVDGAGAARVAARLCNMEGTKQ